MQIKTTIMKKVIILAVAMSAMAAMTSCKKDRTCTCTFSEVEYVYELNDLNKSDATEVCDAWSVSADEDCILD